MDTVEHTDGKKYVVLTEGAASVLYENENQVFYNPVQRFNRDLSTLAIRAWSEEFMEKRSSKKKNNNKRKAKKRAAKDGAAEVETAEDKSTEAKTDATPATITDPTDSKEEKKPQPYLTILEALSATGLRAIRYALEIPNLKTVIANDFSAAAVSAIERNVKYNAAPAAQIVKPSHGDANMVMYSHKSTPFHCIDLDPYGTAAPFVDAAVQAIADDGLLLVTCTDLAVLAGQGYPEKCFSSYGGTTSKTEFCHEAALRLVLNLVATTAARYGKAIEPLMSLSIDFYVRLFIRIKHSPFQVKSLASNTMVAYTCTGCNSTSCQPLGRVVTDKEGTPTKHSFPRGPPVGPKCDNCGFVHHMAGPMWGGRIHNKSFISKVQALAKTADPETYKTLPRINSMLTVASEELDDAPFYFTPQKISSVVRCTCPTLTGLGSALLNAGYKVSPTHAAPGAIKTDAGWDIVYDVMREFIKEHPVTESNIKQGSPATKILERREPKIKIDFTEHPDANPPSRKIKITRYPHNPKNWGPLPRATGDKPKNKNKGKQIKTSAVVEKVAAEVGGAKREAGESVDADENIKRQRTGDS
ncbi:N2,N2-dimethylguanosine tRNA methyltransferase [Myxozyma melibiosi]|uniref:tRNA (guanine(26)-N(2))-dimethyltransferase n=1 Tax=Myxozyma melibiosi TaxID=54550 RepID=A0ABR1F1W5_9ASCO